MYIGVDIGGSHIEVALLDDAFSIINSKYFENNRNIPFSTQFLKLEEEIDKMFSSNVKSISFSIAGIVDTQARRVIKTSNISAIDSNVFDILEEKYHVPVYVDNDINTATIAEYFQGNLKDVNNGMVLAIGTGIGSGIIINGNIYRGNGYTAGEIGHIKLIQDGILCGCGKNGCYERYASLNALRKAYIDNHIETDIYGGLTSTNSDIRYINERWLNYLTDGIAMIYNILDLDKLLIGGGLSEYFDIVKYKVTEMVKQKIYNPEKNVVIDKTFFENKAGIIGATMLDEIRKG